MGLWQVLSEYLFPPKCVFCRRVMKEDGVCDRCKATLPYRHTREDKEPIMFIDGVYSCFYYEMDVRNALIRYKFGGLSKYSVDFALYLEACVKEELEGKFDILSWIPLSKKRLISRGYDQSRLLAEELGKLISKNPVRTLIKRRNTAPQSRQKEASKRIANILGAYDIAEFDVSGKSILLIDDILTTGSTASECARVLKTAGAEKVYLLTVAKTRTRKKN